MIDKNNALDSAAQPDTTASASADYDCYNCGGKESAHNEGCPALRASLAPVSAQQDQVEQAARAMAKHAGWDKWDTAQHFNHTLSGNEPEEERAYWCDLARIALSVSAQQGAAEQHNAVECDSALRAEPASQRNAIVGAIARGWFANVKRNRMMDDELLHAIADEVEAELATRCRAEGGNTNSNSPEFDGISSSYIAAKAPAAQAVTDLDKKQIEPLLKQWFGIDDCKGLFNPERLLAFANAARRTAPEAMTSEQQPAIQQDEDAKDADVREIPLSDMHGARLVKDDDGHWALMRDETLMRYLDRFERGFIDSAIIAAMSAHQAKKSEGA